MACHFPEKILKIKHIKEDMLIFYPTVTAASATKPIPQAAMRWAEGNEMCVFDVKFMK